MADFNPLDYGDPVEDTIPVSTETAFNPLDYGTPVDDNMGDMTANSITDILKRTVSDLARPTLEMGGAVTGALIGAAGGGPAAPLTSVAGSGLGYAIGGEAADLLDQWMGLKEQKSLPAEMLEAWGRTGEGVLMEGAGQGVVNAAMPFITKAGRMVKDALPPLTPKASASRAGEILYAMTEEGPLIAKNIKKATELEKEIPGLKFTRGQKTGDPGTIKLERSQAREPGSFAKEELDQKAANSRAIRKFLESKKGHEGIDEALTSARGMSDSVNQGVLEADARLVSEVKSIDGGDVQESGKVIKKVFGERSQIAKNKAGKLFEDLPDMDFEASGLHAKLGEIRQPFDRYEDISEDVIPGVLERAMKLIEADGNKISLKEAQSLSSNIGKQIRGAGQKEPAYLSRLKQAKGAVDDVINNAEPSVVNPEKAAITQKFEGMKAEVNGSETRGSGRDQEGGRIFYSASSPPWMRNMQETVKRSGGVQFSRKEINTLIDKVSAGKTLTDKQAGRFQYIDDASKEFEAQVNFGEADDLISDGFEPMGGRSTPAGELNQGDEFVGKVNGKDGTFKVEATNDGGAVLVDENGVDYELGISEKVTIDGMKTGKDISKLSSSAQSEAEKQALKSTQKQAASDLKHARTTYRVEYIEKFKQGEVKNILAKGKDGADKVQSAQIASKFFKSGRAGADAADQFIAAAGNDPKAKQAILDYASQDLIQSAVKPLSGEITESGLNRWLHKNKIALEKYGLTDKFSNVKKARTELTKATAFKNKFEKSATARLLGVDPEKAIAKAVGTDNQRQALMELIETVKGDKTATAGLQNALIDHMVETAKVETKDSFGRRIVNPKKLGKAMRKYRPAIKALYADAPQKIKALKTVQEAYETIQKNVASPVGGGSDTMENLITVTAKKAFLGLGKVSAVVKAAMSPIRGYSDKQVNMFLNRALLDPDFSTTIIMASKGAKPDIVKRRLAGHMATMGIIATKDKNK